ncbi:MAG: AfsR/SARP family transcriptional regulator [Acidimicrobiia bacterium]|nr:AfsR/SARP family transcriptional regulator [Acidimicrobiia bacterium]
MSTLESGRSPVGFRRPPWARALDMRLTSACKVTEAQAPRTWAGLQGRQSGGAMRSSSATGPAVCVLGPVSLLVDGRPIPIGGPMPRRLLAALLVNRDAMVSADRLLEVLWGDEPPDSALSSLHSYLSRLRRLLPPSARLETLAPGYRLVVEPGTVDVDRLEAALTASLGRLAYEPQAALVGLDEALAMWLGDAFAEFCDEWWARGEASRLEELRLHAREARAEAMLALGQHEAAVGEARALTADHPGRERAWRTLVLGLHRAGRQGEALRCAGEYRAWLRESSGLDPSPDFVALENDVAVDAAQLRAASPAEPAAVVSSPGRLPAPPTDFIGRVAEVGAVAALVQARRVTTLTGPGGVGKTRLAVEVAGRVEADYAAGARWVDLGSLNDPGAVPFAAAAALGVTLQGGRSPTESVVDALRGWDLLLVLDNCEHVIDTCVELVGSVLVACPTVAVLATSREPLGLAGEVVHNVPSLGAEGDAMDLFVERARSTDDAFVVDDAAVVVELCRRLDGIPLAIELAAARVRSMSVSEMLDMLHDRFRLLRGGRRGGVERHQTLRSAVEWSYQLLTPERRLLFERLSVFSGAFDRDAAAAICGTAPLDPLDVTELLTVLVDRSMVAPTRSGRTTRFGLLETLRQFGEDELNRRGELAELRARHLTYFATAATRADENFKGSSHAEGRAFFEDDWDNLRSALQWALTDADAGAACQLVAAAARFAQWEMRHELGDWARQVLGQVEASQVTPAVLAAAARAAIADGRHDEALRLARRGVAVAEERQDPALGYCWNMVYAAHWYSGRSAAAVEALERSIDACVAGGDLHGESSSHVALTICWETLREPERAVASAAQAARSARAAGNPVLVGQACWAAGFAAYAGGDLEEAERCFRAALRAGEAAGATFAVDLAHVALAGRIGRARGEVGLPLFRDALTTVYESRDWQHIWAVLECCACTLEPPTWSHVVAPILGHLDATGRGHSGYVEARPGATARLGDTPEVRAARAAGAAMSREELVAFVLERIGG